jgi:hypothetical protein
MKKTMMALCGGLILGLAASAIGSEPQDTQIQENKDCSPKGGACKKTLDCCGRFFCKKNVCSV